MGFDRSVIVDSSVWIAYFDKDDSHSCTAEKLLVEWTSSYTRLIVTSFVVQEVCTVLLYHEKHEALKTFFSFIKENGNLSLLVIDMELIERALIFANRHAWRPKISLNDWVLLYLAAHIGDTLATFDRQLINAYARFTKASS